MPGTICEVHRRGISPLALLHMVIFAVSAFAQTNIPSTESFLPKTMTDAVYVEIERDPALDDYGRRIQAARAKNPEWFADYGRRHQMPGVPAPYHENFGVSKEEYERFSQPMNHFREVKRKEIQLRRSGQNGDLQLEFQGDDLLLQQIVLNQKDDSAKTPTDVLPKGRFVDIETASLPPGRHRGVHFTTPQARVAATKRRESLLIGELKDKKSGIIHYSVNTPGQVKMIYIQFTK